MKNGEKNVQIVVLPEGILFISQYKPRTCIVLDTDGEEKKGRKTTIRENINSPQEATKIMFLSFLVKTRFIIRENEK